MVDYLAYVWAAVSVVEMADGKVALREMKMVAAKAMMMESQKAVMMVLLRVEAWAEYSADYSVELSVYQMVA